MKQSVWWILFLMLQVHSHNSPAQTTAGPEDDADDCRQHLGGGHDTVHTKFDILHHVHRAVSQRRATGHLLRRVARRHHHRELPRIRVSDVLRIYNDWYKSVANIFSGRRASRFVSELNCIYLNPYKIIMISYYSNFQFVRMFIIYVYKWPSITYTINDILLLYWFYS